MNISTKTKNILLLTRCMVGACWRGRANTILKTISRIIVAPDGKLGDVVCATPVLAAVRTHFPHARVIVGGNAPFLQDLLSHSGLADEYLELGGGEAAVAQIRNCRADVALVTGPSYASVAHLYLAGIPLIIAPRVTGGYSPLETRPYRILTRFITTFPYQMGAYAPRERLRVLEPLGIIYDDTTKHLGFSEAADGEAKQLLTDAGIMMGTDFVVGISPSAGHKIKEWPEERFAEVADYLIDTYHARVVLIGGPGDHANVQGVLKNIKNTDRVINTQGQLDLDELKALIATLGLFVAVDTGPIYIAEAFGVPTVDITGPIDENEQPPRGLRHRNIVPRHRLHPELFVLNARTYNRAEAERQTMSISVSQVLQEIDALLATLHVSVKKLY